MLSDLRQLLQGGSDVLATLSVEEVEQHQPAKWKERKEFLTSDPQNKGKDQESL